jgi:hypothetical protein
MAHDPQHKHAFATHPLLTGSGLAVLSLPVHLVLPAETSVLVASLTLGLIAGVYLGFAFVDGRISIMFTELFVALAFTAAALAAVLSWPAWVAVAWAAHGLWDWAHHRERVPTRMPRWYVPFCAVYDLIYAAGLLGIWWIRGVLA